MITSANRFQITHADRAIWGHGFVVFDVTGKADSVWRATWDQATATRDELRKAATLLREIAELLTPVGWVA